MSRVRAAAGFAAQLYAQRALILYYGYGRRDPMARLALAAGRVNPYPIYEQIRAAGPMAPTRLRNWVTAGHPLVSQVLRDRRFGVQERGAVATANPMDLSFLERDPPDHTRLRRLAAPAFGPRRMAEYRPRVEQVAGDLIDRATRQDEFDLVSQVAAPLPIAVITDLLGIPDADADRFARYGTTIGSALDGVKSLRHARELMAAQAALERIFTDVIELRRHQPADDLISRLVAAEGDSISASELTPMCQLLLLAGFETTVNLIGNAVHALLAEPEQWALLRSDPRLAGRAVEEALRFDPAVQRTARVAHEDVEIGGVPVTAGQWVVTLIGGANRDPDVYSDPARFDLLRRPAAEHLAFSGGIHYCLGAPLARLEAEVALATLAQRVDLVGAGRVVRRPGTTIRGLLRFPVRARPARRSVVPV